MNFRDTIAKRCVSLRILYDSITSAYDYKGVLANFYFPETAEHSKKRNGWM